MSTSKPVALLYANIKGNIGDFAILDSMLRDINRRFPGQPIEVYSHGFLQADERRLDAFQVSSGTPEFKLVGLTFFRSVPLVIKRLYKLRVWPWVQRILISRLVRQSLTAAKRFAKYEAIFLAGGDQWNGMDLGISMFATLLAVSRYNSNILHYPFSLNPDVRNYNFDIDLRRYFAFVKAPLPVRDSITFDLATRIGLPVRLVRDSVYLLSDVGQAVPAIKARNAQRILLVLTGSHSRVALRRSLGLVLERLQYHEKPVEMLTTCEIEDLDIYAELGKSFGVDVRVPMTWQETVSELKSTAIVVTDRLHCLILGTFAECTLFPVTDRKKAEAFVRDTNILHYCARIEDITCQQLDEAMANRADTLHKMQQYRDLSCF